MAVPQAAVQYGAVAAALGLFLRRAAAEWRTT
jgi:hypothetical protein